MDKDNNLLSANTAEILCICIKNNLHKNFYLKFLAYPSVNLTLCDYIIWIFCVKLIFNTFYEIMSK